MARLGRVPVPPSSRSHDGMEPHARRSDFLPENLRCRARADRGHVIFTPSPGSPPIIGVDPGLWDHSVAGALRPLVLRSPAQARNACVVE